MGQRGKNFTARGTKNDVRMRSATSPLMQIKAVRPRFAIVHRAGRSRTALERKINRGRSCTARTAVAGQPDFRIVSAAGHPATNVRPVNCSTCREGPMTTRKRNEPKRKPGKRRVRRGAAMGVVPPATTASAAEEAEKPFDEPATPPPPSIVPVEEPTPRATRPEEPDVCGTPDESRTDASDLH